MTSCQSQSFGHGPLGGMWVLPPNGLLPRFARAFVAHSFLLRAALVSG
jgi:hypothetical protein